MSADATNTALLLEPLPPAVFAWGRLAPACECCSRGRAVARCWFRAGFAFVTCAICAQQIAAGELMAFALRRAWSLS
ncbi:MAG TPA: hypothetical protein VNO55_31715 [Polyangia bacterium]|nr:hypothetical protein [Polyangia bacterium]